MSSLAKFLSQAKFKTPSIGSANEVPGVSADSPVASEAPPKESVPAVAEESVAATSRDRTEASSLPSSGGSLKKLLSTPKPTPMPSPIPTHEAILGKMDLEAVSEITDENQLQPTNGAEVFRFQLDQLDSLLVEGGGSLDLFNIDKVRNMIARIMIDWKANPSYEGLVVDTDVRNIMKFMYDTQQRAIQGNAEKAVKAVKSADSKSRKAGVAKAVLDIDFNEGF